jgi:hypothetical protein
MHLVVNIREGLKLWREACREAFKDGKQTEKVTEEVMNRIWEPHKINYWKEQIAKLDYNTRLLFYGATSVALKKVQQDPLGDYEWLEVTSIEILNEYRKVCQTLGEKPIYEQRVSWLLHKQLSEKGYLIREDVVSMGRGKGRTARYLYGMNPITVHHAFKEMGLIKT